MRTGLDRRLAALFVTAVSGVLLVLGLLLLTVSPIAFGGYLLLVVAGLVLVGRRARTLRRSAARPPGRTCSCCTTSVHDPVRVI